MRADPIDDFHRLFGDVDGDRIVGLRDHRQFSVSLLSESDHDACDAAVDYDDDGDVDSRDHAPFRRNLLRALRWCLVSLERSCVLIAPSIVQQREGQLASSTRAVLARPTIAVAADSAA